MSEIIDALDYLEKEKNISKDELMTAIEEAVKKACEQDFGKNTDFHVEMDQNTGEIHVFTHKTVVEQMMDKHTDILLEDAQRIDPSYQIDDEVPVEITTKDFGRIAAQKARAIILQKIKESERKSLYDYFKAREGDIITGIAERYIGSNLSVNLDDKTETILNSKEMIPGERFRPGERIKLYIVEVKGDPAEQPREGQNQKRQKNAFRIVTSRTHPELVKRLFEREVTEIQDGTVEIKSISREAGSRSKIAVYSSDPNVDPVGACVGVNGIRVNSVVDDLYGEKIDIIQWSPDPAVFIENSLRPSKVVSVLLDEEEKAARVVVPDYQLSLAIGREGQNARLAARLTGYRIDIKSETQERELEEEEAREAEEKAAEEETEEATQSEDIETGAAEDPAVGTEPENESGETVEEETENSGEGETENAGEAEAEEE